MSILLIQSRSRIGTNGHEFNSTASNLDSYRELSVVTSLAASRIQLCGDFQAARNSRSICSAS
jgi:hypothetical protein